MRRIELALLGLAALSGVGCGSDAWHGQIDRWALPNVGTDGPPDASTSEASGSCPADDNCSDGGYDASGVTEMDAESGPSAPVPDPSLEIFDPTQVYLLGTLVEGQCGFGAIANVLTPNLAVEGFDCFMRSVQVRPSDGRLVYLLDGSKPANLYVFHDDSGYVQASWPYPDNPVANDELVSAATCSDGLGMSEYLISPDSEVVHHCYSTAPLYDATGTMLPGTGYFSFGPQRTLLSPSGILSLETMAIIPITGLPSGTPLTTRTRPDGYWLVLEVSDGDAGASSTLELWRVGLDGTASRDGAYPAPPAHQQYVFSPVLDAQGRLYHFSSDDSQSAVDTIVRRSIEGESDVIYTELSDPLVKVHASALVTGP